jgi:transposase
VSADAQGLTTRALGLEALIAMKGFEIVAAMITIGELGDLTRFAHPRQLIGFLGLVPTSPG